MRHGVCLKLKPVGKPDAVAPHVRFDERGRETGLNATAPVLDSTAHQIITKIPELRFVVITIVEASSEESLTAKACFGEVRKRRTKRHARRKTVSQ
jgi:hypothetical protein